MTGAEAVPVLVAVAHGTRDPAGPDAIHRLLASVRARLPGVCVVGGYVELVSPSMYDVLRRLTRPAVVVPLLLSTGHHLRTDLPAAVGGASAPVAVAPPLGPSPLLTTALVDRARSAGADDRDPVVLAAAGSSDPAATAAVRRAVRLLDEARAGPVSGGFVFHQAPGVDTAVTAAARQTGRAVTVVPYLLAPGRFAAALAEVVGRHPPARLAAPLAGHPAVADLVVRRYRRLVGGTEGTVRWVPNRAADGPVSQAG